MFAGDVSFFHFLRIFAHRRRRVVVANGAEIKGVGVPTNNVLAWLRRV